MEKEAIDWLLVVIVLILFILAAFLGFGPTAKYMPDEGALGGFIACFCFLIYGGAGLIRRRILFGSGALLLKGFWAILASSFFFAIGCFGIFKFFTE